MAAVAAVHSLPVAPLHWAGLSVAGRQVSAVRDEIPEGDHRVDVMFRITGNVKIGGATIGRKRNKPTLERAIYALMAHMSQDQRNVVIDFVRSEVSRGEVLEKFEDVESDVQKFIDMLTTEEETMRRGDLKGDLQVEVVADLAELEVK